jgi:hypothetical protein
MDANHTVASENASRNLHKQKLRRLMFRTTISYDSRKYAIKFPSLLRDLGVAIEMILFPLIPTLSASPSSLLPQLLSRGWRPYNPRYKDPTKSSLNGPAK